MALQGKLPVVASFATFLAARANEQIYNNACERTKIIHICNYAGLLPAGPGNSHQSIRDISLLGSLPDFTILQPCNALESAMVLEYCVNETPRSSAIRLLITSSPDKIELPADYHLTFGRGVALTEGRDAVLFAYGPVMLREALEAAVLLKEDGIGLKVINMPWLKKETEGIPATFVLEDHASVGGLGDRLLPVFVEEGLLTGGVFSVFGVEGIATWGTAEEVLKHHNLDRGSIASRIKGCLS